METRLPGVYPQRKKNKELHYRSSITVKRKHISLGSFATMLMAHAAYLEAKMIVRDKEITLHDYTSHRVLPYSKWVVLLNFRESGLYFNTPIMIKQKFFEYHLAPGIILKFDAEDLFFYSSRAIMKRGGHYFICDFGMQINILNRYGIKNYAVKDRDYRFMNGDEYDFRYENIEIINRFNGVLRVTKRGKHRFRVKLHIVGNYTVGTYESEVEAAIAYNKAVDIVKKAGVTKQFVPNYIENISGKTYAEIYSKIAVSPKITAYVPPKVTP
ncbi:MAG: hypothetical protein LBC96_04240 [Lachnospiraceae bacterium]|jgi:hypothetical protein|nr:hypothetical protein [Lachnospiraceae bacterium]